MKTIAISICLVFLNIGNTHAAELLSPQVQGQDRGRTKIEAEPLESLRARASSEPELIPLKGLQAFDLVKNGVPQDSFSPALLSPNGLDLDQFQWLQILGAYIDVAKASEIPHATNNFRRPEQIFTLHLTVPIYFHLRYQLKGAFAHTFSNGTISAVSRISIQRRPGEDITLRIDLLDWKDGDTTESLVRWMGFNGQFDNRFIESAGHAALKAYFDSESGREELRGIIEIIQIETYQERTDRLLKKAKSILRQQRPLIIH
jgi:hypothetical protein